jgi:hypothetical protein
MDTSSTSTMLVAPHRIANVEADRLAACHLVLETGADGGTELEALDVVDVGAVAAVRPRPWR